MTEKKVVEMENIKRYVNNGNTVLEPYVGKPFSVKPGEEVPEDADPWRLKFWLENGHVIEA